MRESCIASLGIVLLSVTGCGGQDSDRASLNSDLLVHLEDHLEQASLEGSDLPGQTANAFHWDFSEDQAAWKTIGGRSPGPIAAGDPSKPPRIERIDDALRLHLGADDGRSDDPAHGVLYIDLPGLRRDEWNTVLVRVRTSDPLRRMGLAFNLSDDRGNGDRYQRPWRYFGEDTVIVADGLVHTYQLRADWTGPWFGKWEDPWNQVGLMFDASKPSSVDVLSIERVSK